MVPMNVLGTPINPLTPYIIYIRLQTIGVTFPSTSKSLLYCREHAGQSRFSRSPYYRQLLWTRIVTQALGVFRLQYRLELCSFETVWCRASASTSQTGNFVHGPQCNTKNMASYKIMPDVTSASRYRNYSRRRRYTIPHTLRWWWSYCFPDKNKNPVGNMADWISGLSDGPTFQADSHVYRT